MDPHRTGQRDVGRRDRRHSVPRTMLTAYAIVEASPMDPGRCSHEPKIPDDPPDLDQQLQQLFCEVRRREANWRFADRLDILAGISAGLVGDLGSIPRRQP